ncbi:MAG: peptidoglycan-associated lipoprotein Pal [Nitrospirota bacterium]
MRKIICILLISMVLAIGCSKKHIKDSEIKESETGSVRQEPGVPEEKTEVVEDISVPEDRGPESGVQEGSISQAGGETVFISNDVLFDYDKYTIKESARPGLNAAASHLIDRKNLNIVIEGHCDERGTNEYNLALGEKRARAVKNYLASLGLAPSRMTTVTYGEEQPLCSEQREDCWQRNRRAHIVVQ